MKLFDPVQGKEVDVLKKTFVLKMKPGTKGTSEDPHTPLIEDILGGAAHKWIINDRDNTIAIWASPSNLARIAETHSEIS